MSHWKIVWGSIKHYPNWRPLRYSSQATPSSHPKASNNLKHAWLLPGHDERLPGSWRVDSWYKSIIFIRMFGSGEVVTWSAYMPLHKILILANSENDDLFFFAYFRFRSTMSCKCCFFFLLLKLARAKRREFSGMIHWLTINNNPVPPFPSIPYV